MTNNYVLCFLFNRNLDKLWLLKQNKQPYPGCMNGIGGKLLKQETPKQGIIRKLKEEAGLSGIWESNLQWIGSLSLPDAQKDNTGDDLSDVTANILHYFAAVLPDEMEPMSEDRKIICHETEYIIGRTPFDPYLAGGGDIPYFVKIGQERMMPRR